MDQRGEGDLQWGDLTLILELCRGEGEVELITDYQESVCDTIGQVDLKLTHHWEGTEEQPYSLPYDYC